jgi:hypothetical protein
MHIVQVANQRLVSAIDKLPDNYCQPLKEMTAVIDGSCVNISDKLNNFLMLDLIESNCFTETNLRKEYLPCDLFLAQILLKFQLLVRE